MNAEELEMIVNKARGERREVAYAALTLRRVLDSGKPLVDRAHTEERLGDLLRRLEPW